MAFDFLVPIEDSVLAHCELLPPQALGKNIKKHTVKKGMPPLEEGAIALIGVHESRNAFVKKVERLAISQIRLQCYKLLLGNWNSQLIDIGDIEEGATVEDTYFVIQKIIHALLQKKLIPIIIGATQDITYPAYKAFEGIQKMVNLVAVDSRFDFGEAEELISSQSYMSKIITDKPNNLFNFSNIGYQSYFNAQEEIDLMDRLFFDAYRLGDIIENVGLAEPVLRDAHMVSLDMQAVKASEVGMSPNFSPNGLNGREVCAISRYAGISDKVTVFGIYEAENNMQSFQLIAQIIWYFIEGVNFRIKESPQTHQEDFTKFTVPMDSEDLVFYKSNLSERWWIEIPSIASSHNKSNSTALLPCTEKDYLEACNQNIPERWLKAYKKGLH